MSLIGLCSAHGSPGVTTTALTLAATWPEDRPCLLVEADPFGGVIGARYGLGDTPGLSSLAAVARPLATSASTSVGFSARALSAYSWTTLNPAIKSSVPSPTKPLIFC